MKWLELYIVIYIQAILLHLLIHLYNFRLFTDSLLSLINNQS